MDENELKNYIKEKTINILADYSEGAIYYYGPPYYKCEAYSTGTERKDIEKIYLEEEYKPNGNLYEPDFVQSILIEVDNVLYPLDDFEKEDLMNIKDILDHSKMRIIPGANNGNNRYRKAREYWTHEYRKNGQYERDYDREEVNWTRYEYMERQRKHGEVI